MPNILVTVNAKPRKLTKIDKLAMNNAGRQNLLHEIAELEQRAFALGLAKTGRKLNQAKNACGHELEAGALSEKDNA